MKSIDRYFEIIELFPLFFRQNENLNIVLDKKTLEDYAVNFDNKIGVIYESPYYLFIVDLIRDKSGGIFKYSRIINPNINNGVVIIPCKGEKFGLLKQFRHGTREIELEFPRGFSEPNITSEDNVRKELYEEIGARAIQIEFEGSIISDSGITGGLVDVFTVQIDEVRDYSTAEGIKEVIWVNLYQIKELIKENKIRDSFTIAAISKYLINREVNYYV